MVPLRKRRFTLHKKPSFASSLTPSHRAPPPLSSSPPGAPKHAKLAAEDRLPQPEIGLQLLSLAVEDIPVSLMLQLSLVPAPSTTFHTKTQFLRQPLRLFLKDRLHAFRVHLLVSWSSNKILAMSGASPLCKSNRLILPTLSSSTK